MISIFFFCFFVLLYIFLMNYFSFLNSLLYLESMSLLLFLNLFFLMSSFFSLKFILFYFVFIVSESAIGLSILVKLVKTYGLMNFRSLNLLMF